MSENNSNEYVRKVAEQKYEFGFTTDVHTDIIPKGLNEDVVRLISEKKGEPEWLLDFRLKAFRHWQTMEMPKWPHLNLPEIDYQAISYYADPLAKKPKNKEIDPELEKTFDKLGIPLEERLALSGVAVDAIMDSVSVKTTFKKQLAEKGIIFCSIGEAVKEHPELVRQYLGTVVPYKDNFTAALNSAVFSDGSFVYIPKGVRCPMELSSYFRINAMNTGQFERTLIIADDDSYVSYLEGCTAPMRDENQLHAAIVEIVVLANAEVKYSTVQNWYPGDENGKGGVLNLVTKRGDLRGKNSKLSWTQVETGSAITWKYPSCILRGDNSQAEFYSVAVTNNYQEADTGTKMIHLGKNTKSTIISKGISAGKSQNSYRGLVRVAPNADNARNYSSCDSLLLGSTCGAHTFPYMDVHNDSAIIEHEATTSKISEDQLFYCNQRGIPMEDAIGLIVNGYAKDVLNKLPMELSSYFRINAMNTGQFERTLIIADDDSYVSYLEGCTAPMRDENQLHAAIVEIVVLANAEVKYSTVQNWYPGDENGKGGVLNLVTKRGDLRGKNSKLSWTQVETGSAITWKYPSCILRGDNSQAEFYSVAVTNNYQEADTGTKMIHLGKNTKSTIISKGISAGKSQNSYRGLVRVAPNADNARNYSSCDSLLLGSTCGAHTFPYMDVHNDSAIIEHEATTSKISEDQLFYCNQRGIPMEDAIGLIVNGYAKDVLNKLPMEFAVEAQKLLSVTLEGTVG